MLATIDAWLAYHGDDEPLVILDTLGKVMPPSIQGESSYQRDYRVGSALKRLVDARPGSALLVNHHDRKASADDFVDAVSGTHGLAGAADTILVLCRARQEADGLLKVTGRDVAEGEYAVRFDPKALWQLDGDTFDDAAATARQRQATAGVGDRMADVIDFVGDSDDPVSPRQVADAVGITYDRATTYLARAVKGKRLVRSGRGLYSAVRSVRLTESLVSGPAENSQPHTLLVSDAAANQGISQSHTSHSLLEGDDDRCTACGVEVERYDPDGTPWCEDHYPDRKAAS